MKKFYVPRGETVCLADLHTEQIIVEGTLKVSGKLTTKHMQGHGYVEAEEIQMRVIFGACPKMTRRRVKRAAAHLMGRGQWHPPHVPHPTKPLCSFRSCPSESRRGTRGGQSPRP